MPSLPAKFIKQLLNLKPHSWAGVSMAKQRTKQVQAEKFFALIRTTDTTPAKIQGITAEWISPLAHTETVVLYLHGGAYVLGLTAVHRAYMSRFAAASRTKVLAIDYRLAPEHPFPAALEDTIAAYQWLIAEGTSPSQIVIAGDSAGGGLALAAIAALRDAGDPLPICAVCISPWVDLTMSCKSIHTNANTDPVLSKAALAPCADAYAGTFQKDHPLISPLFADLAGFPPLMIHVSIDEILHDEAIQLKEKAFSAGVDVDLKTWEGMFHVFQLVPFLSESQESLDEITDFIECHRSAASV